VLLESLRGYSVVALSVFVAFVLAAVTLPDWVPEYLSYARPRWLALVVFYWVIALPHRHDVVLAWGSGLLMDVLVGGVLGQHALAMLVVAAIGTRMYQRVRMYTSLQQVLLMLAVMTAFELILYFVDLIATGRPWQWWHVLTVASSAGFWPWVFLILRYSRRQYAVV
jgi:rod shape-determining protein MreD